MTNGFSIGDRVVAIKEMYKRAYKTKREISIYGYGEIVRFEIPNENAFNYVSELARDQKIETAVVKLDENDAYNELVYGTECLMFKEELFLKSHSDVSIKIASIVADRYKYWARMQKEERGKLE